MPDMTLDELAVVIRVSAQGADDAADEIRSTVNGLQGELKRAGAQNGEAYKPLKNSTEEAAAAQAVLSAACTAAFAKINDAVRTGTEAYNQYTAAVKGLGSIADGRGIGQEAMQAALDDVTDAFMSASAAATAYKNLLSRGYTLEQATQTITRLKDAAAFGRQASLSLEDAVVSATEGIRNENSILVDNAGVTKNVAKMWEDYAKAHGISTTAMTQAEKIEAEYQGIMAETALQVGDLAKASDTLMGAQAEQQAQTTKLATAYGEAMQPAVQAVTETSTGLLAGLTAITSTMPEMTSGVTAAAGTLTGLLAVIQGVTAAQKLFNAAAMSSPLMAGAAVLATGVGIIAAAYTAYVREQDAAAEAQAQTMAEQQKAVEENKRKLQESSSALSDLLTQEDDTKDAVNGLAGAVDSQNNALIDSIRLAREQVTAYAEVQLAAEQASLAVAQARLDALESLDSYTNTAPRDPKVTGTQEDWGGVEWQAASQAVLNWYNTVAELCPEAATIAQNYLADFQLAESAEAADAAWDEFLSGLGSKTSEAKGDVENLQSTVDALLEAMADPDSFEFDKVFGDTDDAADGLEDIGDSAEDTQERIETLSEKAKALQKTLNNTAAIKKMTSSCLESAKAAKQTGKGWDGLTDEAKQFARRLGTTEGDIDGLIISLESMEGTLNTSFDSGVAEIQNVLSELEIMRAEILNIPEGEMTLDNSQALDAINAAIALINVFLSLLGQSGISMGGKSSGGGGGGGSRKSSSDDDGGGGEDHSQDEAYRKEIERIEHLRHMEQISAEEEIKLLERVKAEYAKTDDQIMDIDEKLFDARKDLIEDAYDAQIDAIQHQNAMDELTTEQELALLQQVQDEYAKTAEQQDEIAERIHAAQKALYDDAMSELEHLMAMDALTTQEQIEQLEMIRDTYAMTTEQMQTVEERLYETRKELQEENYQAEVSRIERMADRGEITAQEQIAMLEHVLEAYAETAEQIEDIDERLYEARQALRERETEKLDVAADALTSALKAQYKEQQEIEKKRLDESTAAWKAWSTETCAAIQAQIDALSDQAEAENREATEAENVRKIGSLKQALEYETDEYNQTQLQKQIEQAEAAWEKIQADWARSDEKDALKAEMQAVKDKAEEQQELNKAEAERIDSVYDELTSSLSLAAEAQKLLMQGSQEEILELLTNYAPDYAATGKTLGEKLYEGFISACGDITTFFDALDSQFEMMIADAQTAAGQASQSLVMQGANQAQTTSPTTINQTINFNQPVESAADVTRQMQDISYRLAEMI